MNNTKLQHDSYIRFFPVQSVNFIKVGSIDTDEGAPTFSEAKLQRNHLAGEDILLTHYDDSTVNAKYFPPASTNKTTMTTYTVYRKTPDQNYYKYLYTLKDGAYAMKDYDVKSDHYYHYLMTVEDQKTNEVTGEKVIDYTVYENTDENANLNYYRCVFNNWTICDIEETDDSNIYTKVGNIWKLGLNINGESISTNLNIVAQETLGKYPKIFIGNRNYESMSFSGLLGNMYEFRDYSFCREGNIESQSGTDKYIYTERQDTELADGSFGIDYGYSTEVQKLEAWKEFITNGSLKLLKDTKGNAWIIQISEATSYDIELASNLKQTTVNFSWKEVKSLSDISIIVEE